MHQTNPEKRKKNTKILKKVVLVVEELVMYLIMSTMRSVVSAMKLTMSSPMYLKDQRLCDDVSSVLCLQEVCFDDCEQDENMNLLNEYKSKFILPLKYLEDFSKGTKLSFLSYRPDSHAVNAAKKKLSNSMNDEMIVEDSGIYTR